MTITSPMTIKVRDMADRIDSRKAMSVLQGPGNIAGVITLLLLSPGHGMAFWLILAAFFALIVRHAVCRVLLHPINNFWLRDLELENLDEAA